MHRRYFFVHSFWDTPREERERQERKAREERERQERKAREEQERKAQEEAKKPALQAKVQRLYNIRAGMTYDGGRVDKDDREWYNQTLDVNDEELSNEIASRFHNSRRQMVIDRKRQQGNEKYKGKSVAELDFDAGWSDNAFDIGLYSDMIEDMRRKGEEQGLRVSDEKMKTLPAYKQGKLKYNRMMGRHELPIDRALYELKKAERGPGKLHSVKEGNELYENARKRKEERDFDMEDMSREEEARGDFQYETFYKHLESIKGNAKRTTDKMVDKAGKLTDKDMLMYDINKRNAKYYANRPEAKSSLYKMEDEPFLEDRQYQEMLMREETNHNYRGKFIESYKDRQDLMNARFNQKGYMTYRQYQKKNNPKIQEMLERNAGIRDDEIEEVY